MAPAIKTKAGEYAMPEAVAEAYRRIYPTADDEFARMVIWLETNAARRPASPKSAPRFVQNWFKRVPRKPQQARHDFMAAFTGRTGNGHGGNDRPAVRQDGGGLRRAEDVIDVEWCRPVGGAGHLGADVIALLARRVESGG